MPDSPEVAAFKERLWNVTQQAANNYGWCGTWRDAMADLGVGPPAPETTEYEVRVTYRVTSEAPDADALQDALHYTVGRGGAAVSLAGQYTTEQWSVDSLDVEAPDRQPF